MATFLTKEDITTLLRIAELVKTIKESTTELNNLWGDNSDLISPVLNPHYPHCFTEIDGVEAEINEWHSDVDSRTDYIIQNLKINNQ